MTDPHPPEVTADAQRIRSGKTGDRVSATVNWFGLGLCTVPLVASFSGGSSGKDALRVAIGTALVVAFWNLTRAYRLLAGTSLRPATVWAMLAVAIATLGMFGSDISAPGRPREGLLAHLTFLATLAALVSVLGARRPGENAWAILCGLFLLIGLLPMLEGIGLARRFDVLDRLRLESPWSYFFVLVIFAGVSNYLPTRFVISATLLGAGLSHHLYLLWKPLGRAEWRGTYWFVLPWCLAATILVAALSARRVRRLPEPAAFHGAWFPFRDAWGAAWALRVLERFNQTAVRNDWPVRLQWFGLYETAPRDSAQHVVESADYEAALNVFLRRFGDLGRIRNL